MLSFFSCTSFWQGFASGLGCFLILGLVAFMVYKEVKISTVLRGGIASIASGIVLVYLFLLPVPKKSLPCVSGYSMALLLCLLGTVIVTLTTTTEKDKDLTTSSTKEEK